MELHPDLASRTINITSMTNTNCCECGIKTPDDGQLICPKHVEFFIKIKLSNSASRWRSLCMICCMILRSTGPQELELCTWISDVLILS